MKSNTPFQFFLKALGCPAMFQEEKFEPGAFPVLAQLFALAKNLGNSLENWNHLVPVHKSVQPNREMRIGREPAADPQGKTNFRIFRRRIAVRPTSLISG